MSGWAILNLSAWVISAIIAVVLIIDFVKIEKRNKHRAE